jgi:hypothetical protein
MESSHPSRVPFGVKAIAAWTVLVGAALLLLGVTGAPWYLPRGAAALVAGYGLWNHRYWGLLLAGVVYAVEGIRSAIEGDAIVLLVVLLLLGYLYRQRRQFPSAPA